MAQVPQEWVAGDHCGAQQGASLAAQENHHAVRHQGQRCVLEILPNVGTSAAVNAISLLLEMILKLL